MPTATATLVSTCDGWTLSIAYTGFTSGDVLVGTISIDGANPDSFGVTGVGSDTVDVASGDPAATVDVAFSIGRSDPSLTDDGLSMGFTGLGDSPTLVSATTTCPA